MAKLDEIAELLTEEIRGFENSVGRLEKLQRDLKTFRIEPDTSNIAFILKRYNDHQKKAIEEQHKLMANVVYYIKKSMTFPKWAIKLFWGLLVCIFLVLGFSVYKVSRIPTLEQAAYEQGEEKAVTHFRAFLEASPEASALYEKWREPQNKKVECALPDFCFTLICRNTTKTGQDPRAKFWGKIWEIEWKKRK